MRIEERDCAHCGDPFTSEREGRGRLPKYCSPACQAGATKARRLEAKGALGNCAITECDKPKRSPGSPWCEMHYARNRRNGNPEATKLARPYVGTCYHCGASAGRQRLFCSDLCRRRDRMGAPGRTLTCAICDAALPESANLSAMFCSNACARTSERARRYGIEGRQLKAMLDEADGCGICGTSNVELVVDHCHETGAVRALLCGPCNVGVGMFAEDPARLMAAARYVKEWANVLGDQQSQGEAA